MKHQNSWLKKTKIFIRIIAVCIVLVFLIYTIPYYKFDLYFFDKYMWYIYFGDKYGLVGNFKKSYEYTTKATYLEPKRPEAHKLKVKIYIAGGMYNKAEEELLLLKSMNQSQPYYFFMGIINLCQKNPNESLTYFTKGIEEYPFFVKNHLGMGLAYLQMNDLERALKYLNQSKAFINQSYPNNPLERRRCLGRIHAGLGLIYEQKGEYERAIEEFKKAESFDYRVDKLVMLIF